MTDHKSILDEIVLFVRLYGYEYINLAEGNRHRFKCRYGHIFEETMDNVLKRRNWCTVCIQNPFIKKCKRPHNNVNSHTCGCIQHPVDPVRQMIQVVKRKQLSPSELHLPEYGHNTRQVILDYLYGSPGFQKWQTALAPINEYIRGRCDGEVYHKMIADFAYFDEMKEKLEPEIFAMVIEDYRGVIMDIRSDFLERLIKHNKLVECCGKRFVPYKVSKHICNS